ncbi:hypothetical protein ROT00_07525 [Agromyces mediolanus]|uniref:hypothetical protein n=1 Tax=Agromyces mediolanus TaxID=41986 RepID=UPI00383808AC
MNTEALATLIDSDHARTLHRKGVIPGSRVKFVAKFIDNSRLVEQLEAWRDEDKQARRKGGRPSKMPVRTVLILLFLLALEHSPMHVTEMAAVLDHRLTKKSRRKYELVTGGTLDQLYYRLWRTLENIIATIDPEPLPSARRRRLTPEEYDAIVESRDPDEMQEKQRRLDWLANHILEATYQLVPTEHRKWAGNITVDATPVAAFGRHRSSKISNRLSAEPGAGMYYREPDLRDETTAGTNRRLNAKRVWGWEAELLIQTTNDPTRPADFPLLVLGIAFHKPAHSPAASALGAFRSIISRGHPAGYVIGDRLYFPGSKADSFQLPMRELGYEPIHDYRIDQLGIQGQYAGALLVDGNWYCPSMPKPLIDATLDHRQGRIDDATWQARLSKRSDYRLRRKEKPDSDGHTPLMCPAAGSRATAACPLKPSATRGAKVSVTIGKPPKQPDRICVNKASVSFPPEAGAKLAQPLAHGTDEWQTWYATGRNTIEGFNGYIKDGAREALADATRRRLHGYAAQYLLTTVLVASANIRKIIGFLEEEQLRREGNHVAETRRIRRKRRTSIRAWSMEAEGTDPHIEQPR